MEDQTVSTENQNQEAGGLDGVTTEDSAEDTQGSLDQGAPEAPSAYARSLYEISRGKSETAFNQMMKEIQAAKSRLLAQPTELTRQQYVQGLASRLTTPPERTDPRFYERRNLYTFLRDVGQYGSDVEAAQKAAKIKQAEQAGALDQLMAKYAFDAAQKNEAAAMGLLGKYSRSAPVAKEDEITRLIKIRSKMDPRSAEFGEVSRRIAYLGGAREGSEGPKPTPGEKAMDTEVGKDLAKWTIGGEGARSAARQRRLMDVADTLLSGKNITGPLLGWFTENMPGTFSMTETGQRAINTKDIIESVVQTDLRAILGGQFAQEEGKALIKRAYNPRLTEEQNAARIKLLLKQMQKASEEKNRAASYFNEKGTIKGFKFSQYSPDDFLTDEQIKMLDAGMSPDEILGGAKPAAPAAPAAAKPPAATPPAAAKPPAAAPPAAPVAGKPPAAPRVIKLPSGRTVTER